MLVELDFPQTKELAPALKTQNDGLAKNYGIQGFPTLILLNSEGKKVTQHVGYLPGGPDALIGEIEKAKK